MDEEVTVVSAVWWGSETQNLVWFRSEDEPAYNISFQYFDSGNLT